MNGSFYTNCGGGPGFSGTGLLNSDGHLALIHRDSTDFKYDAESLEAAIADGWNDVKVKCIVNGTWGVMNDCLDSLKTVIGLHAQNLTGLGQAASNVYQLLESKYRTANFPHCPRRP
jgi:hypothetical protein